MNERISIASEFGQFCADGGQASTFRLARLELLLSTCDKLILDFDGVRNMNSSFANALVAPLAALYPDLQNQLVFANCNQSVRVLLIAAVQLGNSRNRDVVT
jgi:anti-anti-sigma regulatory factor